MYENSIYPFLFCLTDQANDGHPCGGFNLESGVHVETVKGGLGEFSVYTGGEKVIDTSRFWYLTPAISSSGFMGVSKTSVIICQDNRLNMEIETSITICTNDHSVLAYLAKSISGMSAEDLGSKLGLDKMLLFYQLDRLVKQGLLKRSRPMFREPELYEVTELGRKQGSV